MLVRSGCRSSRQQVLVPPRFFRRPSGARYSGSTVLCHKALSRLVALGTPAATAALMRDAPGGVQVLLLQKAKNRRFGGNWVFPGGAFEDSDTTRGESGSINILATAANAVARETTEEARVHVHHDSLTFISHWLPPSDVNHRGGRKKYSTFFFCGTINGPGGNERVDGCEIARYEWMRPADALERHASGRLPLLPPTWMTLDLLRGTCSAGSCSGRRSSLQSAEGGERLVGDVLQELRSLHEPIAFETRTACLPDGRMSYMFEGDAGWPTSDPSVSGPRFRLTATPRRSVDVAQDPQTLSSLGLEAPDYSDRPVLALERSLTIASRNGTAIAANST